jgi:hypothetical protein
MGVRPNAPTNETIALVKFAGPRRAEKKEVRIEDLSGKSRMKAPKPDLK